MFSVVFKRIALWLCILLVAYTIAILLIAVHSAARRTASLRRAVTDRDLQTGSAAASKQKGAPGVVVNHDIPVQPNGSISGSNRLTGAGSNRGENQRSLDEAEFGSAAFESLPVELRALLVSLESEMAAWNDSSDEETAILWNSVSHEDKPGSLSEPGSQSYPVNVARIPQTAEPGRSGRKVTDLFSNIEKHTFHNLPSSHITPTDYNNHSFNFHDVIRTRSDMKRFGSVDSHLSRDTFPAKFGVVNQGDRGKYLLRELKNVSLHHDRRPATTTTTLDLCPYPAPNLLGALKQFLLLIESLKESDIVRAYPELGLGGSWAPRHCRPRQKIAIIMPFRDRQSHLNRLIGFLAPILMRQLLDFRFIVTEQYGHGLFNKGRIMNAAFRLAEALGVDCVIFHDVDLFPQNDRTPYTCLDQPLHLGAFVNSLGYELWYNYIAGGVLAITVDQFRAVNGYSNLFWAWGGEDDDMGYRILARNYSLLRPDPHVATFTMLKHHKRQRTAPKAIKELLKTSSARFPYDGVRRRMWRTLSITRRRLYFHLFVDVGEPPGRWLASSGG